MTRESTQSLISVKTMKINLSTRIVVLHAFVFAMKMSDYLNDSVIINISSGFLSSIILIYIDPSGGTLIMRINCGADKHLQGNEVAYCCLSLTGINLL